MDAKVIDILLSHSFLYTYNNTITERDQSNRKRSVVTLNTLDKHLQQAIPTEYGAMETQYSTLFDFFSSENQKKKSKEWIYEIMTTNKYNQDPRRLQNSLFRLQTYTPFSENLFSINYNGAYKVDDCDVELLSRSMLVYYKVMHQFYTGYIG